MCRTVHQSCIQMRQPYNTLELENFAKTRDKMKCHSSGKCLRCDVECRAGLSVVGGRGISL